MRLGPESGQDEATAIARAFVRRLDATDVDLDDYEVELVAGLLVWHGSFTAGQHGAVERLRERYEMDLPPVVRGPMAAPRHPMDVIEERRGLARSLGIDLARDPAEVRREVRERIRTGDPEAENLRRLKDLLP